MTPTQTAPRTPSSAAGAASTDDEGDNEITGIHFSDGDPTVGGILGAKNPKVFRDGWRLFWTQQDGNNSTWEVVPASNGGDD